MSEHSPFALATPAPPPEAPKASFAQNWYVAGIGRLQDEDFVSVKSRDLSSQFTLFGRESNAQNGVTLVRIEWSEIIGKSTVTVQKGTETATLEFNEAEVHGPAQATAANGNGAGGQAAGKLPKLAIPVPGTAGTTMPPYPPGSATPPARGLRIVPPPTYQPPNPAGGPPMAARVPSAAPNGAIPPGVRSIRPRVIQPQPIQPLR